LENSYHHGLVAADPCLAAPVHVTSAVVQFLSGTAAVQPGPGSTRRRRPDLDDREGT